MAKSFASSQASIPLSTRRSGLWERFEKNYNETPSKEALVIYNDKGVAKRLTYYQVKTKVDTYAARLLKAFPYLERGARVGIVGCNRLELVICHLMCCRVGLTTVFPPIGIQGANIIAKAVYITGCKVLFYENTFIRGECMPDVFAKCPSLCDAVTFGGFANALPDRVRIWKEVFECGAPPGDVQLPRPVDGDEDLVVVCTSGSTGEPKAVLYTNQTMLAFCFLYQEGFKQSKDDKFLSDRPVNYLNEVLWVNLAYVGATLVLADTRASVNQTDLSLTLKIVKDESISIMLIFGYMLHDMINIRKLENLRSLRVGVSTGQVLNVDHALMLKDLLPNLRLYNYYASNEAGYLSYECDRYDGYTKIGDEVDMKVINSEGNVVPLGETGKACIRSPAAMKGYIRDVGLVPGLDQDGWLHTDDLVIMNENREIKVLGRASDVIERAGVLIFPKPVEDMLTKHPKVSSAVVIGVPDTRLHEEICAVIVPSETDLTEDELRTWCNGNSSEDHLGFSMVPMHYKFLANVPLLANGKVNKRAIKDIFVSK